MLLLLTSHIFPVGEGGAAYHQYRVVTALVMFIYSSVHV